MCLGSLQEPCGQDMLEPGVPQGSMKHSERSSASGGSAQAVSIGAGMRHSSSTFARFDRDSGKENVLRTQVSEPRSLHAFGHPLRTALLCVRAGCGGGLDSLAAAAVVED